MKIVYFVSGHRDLTEEEFKEKYTPIIDKVISDAKENQHQISFVVGDYEGADKMAQDYLVLKGQITNTTVYHMFEKPRNYNRYILNTKGGFTGDIERDSAMTNDSDFDIAFVRSGKWNSGTAQNIKRRHTL